MTKHPTSNPMDIKIGDGVIIMGYELHGIVEIISDCKRYARVKMLDGKGPHKKRFGEIVGVEEMVRGNFQLSMINKQ